MHSVFGQKNSHAALSQAVMRLGWRDGSFAAGPWRHTSARL
jgi:hypothetical protein